MVTGYSSNIKLKPIYVFFYPSQHYFVVGPFGELILVIDLDVMKEVETNLEKEMFPTCKASASREAFVVFLGKE